VAAKSLVGANVAVNATFTMTNQDSTYPATKGNDKDPALPLKSTTTSTVITITFSGNVVLQAIALINHNLVGATCTLANAAGYSQTITIPARTSDGQCVNAWRDMRTDANTTDDIWTLTITGASANVAIGEILLVTTLNELNWRYGVEFASTHPVIQLTTFYRSRLTYDTGIRVRRASGVLRKETDKATLLSLWQQTKGPVLPFLLIPELANNDAWMVRFTEDEFEWTPQGPLATDASVVVEELSSGLVL
jgi:hypothetical protein